MAAINGRQFGKYVIHEEIGRGGMARVFRATDTALQRTVALKVLSAGLVSDPESSQRFEREAITAANLKHPNIVTIFDVGEIDGVPFIAMEYISGRTLQAVIDERGPLGLGYAVAILMPVAEALDYAHSRGAVHRDIKPHNILINADGRSVLTDFGIAQVSQAADSQRLTRSGIFMGTPEYISPEQAAGGVVDGRSDLYSLAIVAFEVITGQVPFNGTVPELLMAHSFTPPPALSQFVSGLPETLDRVFERALSKKAADRPPTARALIDALNTIASRIGLAIPAREAVAALAIPQGSSAGKATVAMAAVPPIQPRQPATSDQTDVGAYVPPVSPRPARPAPAANPAARPASPAPRPAQQQQRRVAIPPPAQGASAPRPRRQPSRPQRRARTSEPMARYLPFLVIVLLIALGVVFVQRNPPRPIPTTVPQPTSDGGLTGPFAPQPTETRLPTQIPTFTPTATATPEPSPTDAASPEATDEPTDEPTAEPTRTAVPATPTSAPTAEPTAEPTVAPEPTAEPTAEPTVAPIPTVAPSPEVTTQTLPSRTPTATLAPTSTPLPAPTSTPLPAPTSTPAPSPTIPPTAAPPSQTPYPPSP